MGVPAEYGDGNNAAEAFTKVERAVKSIRQGSGPRFFEFATYRWREHCGPNFDNDIGYRTEEEYLAWKERDPLKLLESQLLSEGIIRRDDIEEMRVNIQQEVDQAFDFAERSPFPDTEEAFTGLYR